jgi:uncharacterized OB-fold protein
MELPKPETSDLTRPYWEALRNGHLVIQRCKCGHAFLPARRLCRSCLREEPHWERASGKGVLLSWVVYHVAYHPAFESRLPYNVALVQLEEGPQLLTNILGPNENISAGAPVELEIEREGDTILARFRMVGAAKH